MNPNDDDREVPLHYILSLLQTWAEDPPDWLKERAEEEILREWEMRETTPIPGQDDEEVNQFYDGQ